MKLQHLYRQYCAILVVGSISMLVTVASFAQPVADSSSKSPVRVSEDAVSGIGLEAIPWDNPSRAAKFISLFEGEELSVSVFESGPVKTDADSVSSRVE